MAERMMKDSAVEWIGAIPANWNIAKIKNIADPMVQNSFIDGDWIESPYITAEGIKYYTTGNIGDGIFKYQGNGHISAETFEKLKCKYAYGGDLVISRLNEPYGRSCVIPKEIDKCVLAVDIVIFRPRENFDRRYLCYLTMCDGYHRSIEDKARGTAMKRISRNNLGNVILPVPSLQEQVLIADFLDKKVSEIDAVISKTKESIEEYKKLKQSIITEAITKGLNPNIELKDSGVEWIGMIAKTSRIVKLKNIVEVSDGTHDTPVYVDKNEDSFPLVTSRCIVNGCIDENLAHHISKGDYELINKRSNVEKYDVIMPMIGTVGNPAIVENEGNFAIKNVALFKTHQNYSFAKYLKYILNSNLTTEQFDMGQMGGVQNFVSQDKLKNLIVVYNENYDELVGRLDDLCFKYDALISKKDLIITEFEQYKKSLIYEYVTGKRKTLYD